MHPEVQHMGAGTCPKCGMALEPSLPMDVENDIAIRHVWRKFWLAVAFAMPVLLIAMLPDLLGMVITARKAHTLRLIEFALSSPVVLGAAADYYRRGLLGIMHRAPNMYSLIGLGVIVTFTYSVLATFAPDIFPTAMRDERGLSASTLKSPRSLLPWLYSASPWS
jgi:Cu+-exporting ATPase